MVSVVLCFWKFLEQDQKHELSTDWSRYNLRKAGLWVNVYPCNARNPSITFSMPKPQRAWISMLSREYLDYFSMPKPTRAWRLSSETAQWMYSWCKTVLTRESWLKQIKPSRSWTMCQCLSIQGRDYLDYFSMPKPKWAWRLSSEKAQLMYSWCKICEFRYLLALTWTYFQFLFCHIIVYAYNLYCVGRSFSQAIEAKSQKAKQKGLI